LRGHEVAGIKNNSKADHYSGSRKASIIMGPPWEANNELPSDYMELRLGLIGSKPPVYLSVIEW